MPRSRHAQALLAFIQELHLRMGAHPGPDLTTGQRRSLSGGFFDRAPLLVNGVAKALSTHPHLYPDLLQHIDPQALSERQERADAWLLVRGTLERLHRWAGDHYIHEQAAALQEAFLAVNQIDTELELPCYGGPASRVDRWLHLRPATIHLDQVQIDKAKVRKKNRPADAKKPPRRPMNLSRERGPHGPLGRLAEIMLIEKWQPVQPPLKSPPQGPDEPDRRAHSDRGAAPQSPDAALPGAGGGRRLRGAAQGRQEGNRKPRRTR